MFIRIKILFLCVSASLKQGVKQLSFILSCFGKGILRETEQTQEIQNRYHTIPNNCKLYSLSWLGDRQYRCISVGTMFFPTHTGTMAAMLPSVLHWCCEPIEICSVWQPIYILLGWALMEFIHCSYPLCSAGCADAPFCRIVGLCFSVCQRLGTGKGTI